MAYLTKLENSRVYVLRITTADNLVIHKIGMCNTSRVTDRMMEILRSWFCSYRYVPTTKLLLNINCVEARCVEAYIHRLLKPLAFAYERKTDGSTEMFCNVNEHRLLWFIRGLDNSMQTIPAVTDEQVIKLSEWLSNG